VWLESEPGAGSTFSFTLPAASAGPARASHEVAGGGVVLVVDDDPVLVDLLRRLLPEHGFTVVGAASGEEALEVAASQPVDVVVLDLLMPGMSGWELLEQLRERHPGLPAVVLSGMSPAEEDDAEGATADVAAFLCKPMS
jgi:CheY-like chemotaxis protein